MRSKPSTAVTLGPAHVIMMMCIWPPQNSELNIFVDGYNLLNICRIGESRNILNIFALNISNDSVKIREFIIIHHRVCTPSIEIQESGESAQQSSDLGYRRSQFRAKEIES